MRAAETTTTRTGRRRAVPWAVLGLWIAVIALVGPFAAKLADVQHDKVTDYCDKIKNAQGLLALGTRVFAVGDGPEGVALYRLKDNDRDNVADEVTKLIGFRQIRFTFFSVVGIFVLSLKPG